MCAPQCCKLSHYPYTASSMSKNSSSWEMAEEEVDGGISGFSGTLVSELEFDEVVAPESAGEWRPRPPNFCTTEATKLSPSA